MTLQRACETGVACVVGLLLLLGARPGLSAEVGPESARGSSWTAPVFSRSFTSPRPLPSLPSATATQGLSYNQQNIEAPMAPASLSERPVHRKLSHGCLMSPGDAMVFEIVPGDRAVIQHSGCGELDRESEALLGAAPRWLEARLRWNLNGLSAEGPSKLLSALEALPDPRMRDEFLFLAATVPWEELDGSGFALALLGDNVRALFLAEAQLPFVSFVEHPDPSGGGPGWTSLSYELGDGRWELPRDHYYWRVVHPRLDVEALGYVDPTNGAITDADHGIFWREDIWRGDRSAADYGAHFLFSEPTPIDPSALVAQLSSPRGYYDSLAIGPLNLATGPDGRAAFIEFRIGAGTVIATQSPLSQSRGALLENLVRYGNGNALMPASMWHVVVRDRLSFGDTLIESILEDSFANVLVWSSEELAEALADEDGLDEIWKLIVADDQPLALYERVAEGREALEARIGEGMIFQLQGAVDLADDWCGLAMPGGFSCGSSSDGAGELLTVGGQPHLEPLLQGTSVAWDGSAEILPGERLLDPLASAVAQAGYFTGENLYDNVAEWRAKHPLEPVERSPHPERILRNHFGNCGELQDLLGSAARAMLLPVANVSDSAEDHVWNELYLADAWRPYQVSWSDGPTFIDDPSLAMEKKSGGGKDISWVVRHRGDGLLENVTEAYSEVLPFRITLSDAAGHPLDGAHVLFGSEAWQQDDMLTLTYHGFTAADGSLEVELGDAQNHYLRVEGPLGSWPAEENKVSLVVSAEEAVPGAALVFEHAFDQTLPGRQTILLNEDLEWPPGDDDAPGLLRLQVSSQGAISELLSPFLGATVREVAEDDAGLQVLLLDEAGFADYSEGRPFEARWGGVGQQALDLAFDIELVERVYLIVRADRRFATLQSDVRLDLSFLGPQNTGPDGPPDPPPDASDIPAADSDAGDLLAEENDGKAATGSSDEGCTVARWSAGNPGRGPGRLGVLASLVTLLCLLRRRGDDVSPAGS